MIDQKVSISANKDIGRNFNHMHEKCLKTVYNFKTLVTQKLMKKVVREKETERRPLGKEAGGRINKQFFN